MKIHVNADDHQWQVAFKTGSNDDAQPTTGVA